ncbi:hypothetical protein CRYUN_Cryun28dG0038300 [Craigia yunnanensis]
MSFYHGGILLVSWSKIATRYLLPVLAVARLTPKLCSRVAEAFVIKYGEYAGWAQSLLFIAELPSQKALYHHIFGILKRKNLPNEKTVIGEVVMEAIVEITEMFSFIDQIFEL